MAPFVYIHGKLGGCNYYIAKELSKLMPEIKVVDDNQLVRPARAIFEPETEEYYSLCKEMRRSILRSVAQAEAKSNTPCVFVDQDFTKENKSSLAADYEYAAVMNSSLLISVILKCDWEEILNRAKNDPATSSETLQEIERVQKKTEMENVAYLRNRYELEIDIATNTPRRVAEIIRQHIRTVKRAMEAGKEYTYWGI